ncbi:MAG TPA: hypothetical protein VL092_05240 [Chitinophagaceae bacterium]|nr:hypothetical protein [Chitinophagaceae bacterium]
MNTKYTLQACETDQEIAQAIRLRYIAYRNAAAIPEHADAVFRDKYDLLPNASSCIVYEDTAPVASVRACIYSRELNFLQLPAFEAYRQEIEKELDLDKVIVESNRFVIHPDNVDSKYLFKVPFRFIILNVLKFKSDYILAAVRPKHVPLYRRFLGMEPISAPRKYPGINVDMIMMAGVCSELLPMVMQKEELYRFTDEEVDTYAFSASLPLLEVSYS